MNVFLRVAHPGVDLLGHQVCTSLAEADTANSPKCLFSLDSHQHRMRVLIASHSLQYSVCFVVSHSDVWWRYSHLILTCISLLNNEVYILRLLATWIYSFVYLNLFAYFSNP